MYMGRMCSKFGLFALFYWYYFVTYLQHFGIRNKELGIRYEFLVSRIFIAGFDGSLFSWL